MSFLTCTDAPRASVRSPSHPLDIFLSPESVAIFGGSEEPGSVGRTILFNLIRNPFGGVLYPICPHRSSVLGVRSYTSLREAPAPVDLAIVATSALAVPAILEQCQAAGVKGAVVLSTDFRDAEPAVANVERRIGECLRRGSMRVLGLNSFGVVCPRSGFNATLAPALAPAGRVGFLSQSGALLTALLNEEHSEHVGCSVAISVGSLLDIGWTEWLDYLAGDSQTDCIGIYMESLEDAPSFFAAAREVAPVKPILLVKGGWAGHTDPVRDEVFHDACRSNGVLLVHRLTDLFRMAACLPTLPVPNGRRLAILTNARGPAILANDALCADGGQASPLTPSTIAALERVLPGRPDPTGPIDVGDIVDAVPLARAITMTAHDANVDALLVIFAPQCPFDPLCAAERLRTVTGVIGKPLLTCWMWGTDSPTGLAVLRQAGIPAFHSPESAVRAFGYLWRHSENMRFLAEIREALVAREELADPARAASILQSVRQSGRFTLTETEAVELLCCYGLPGQKRHDVSDEASAVKCADGLGYPVLLETGAGDVGEVVRLKATNADALRRAVGTLQRLEHEHFGREVPPSLTVVPFVPSSAVEVAVRGSVDAKVGPVVRLGQSGRLTAVTMMAPLTPLSAREMIEKAAVVSALRACQGGEPPEFEVLQQFLLRLSRLVVEQPWIREISIDSLVIWERKALARDVRVTVEDSRE
jgi:acetyltransferase